MQKKWFHKSALLLVFIALTVMQGSSGYYDDYYSDYRAVYMDRTNLEQSVFYVETGKEMKNPGKIYFKYPYLFINEKYKGIHIFDNTNPEKPVNKGFIVAPGCLDMAVKDNIIYLDNAVDMVCFDLNDKKKEMKRITNVFPPLTAPDGYSQYRTDGLIIVEWIKRNNNEQ
ncbi:MAG: hypothetical protein LBD76_01880 [Prevotellaceae bacterium]|jgi:hypothetical protein|nr:hypothetical protein [Prevotellaceae bacterium]